MRTLEEVKKIYLEKLKSELEIWQDFYEKIKSGEPGSIELAEKNISSINFKLQNLDESLNEFIKEDIEKLVIDISQINSGSRSLCEAILNHEPSSHNSLIENKINDENGKLKIESYGNIGITVEDEEFLKFVNSVKTNGKYISTEEINEFTNGVLSHYQVENKISKSR